jgi:hypothetical protein
MNPDDEKIVEAVAPRVPKVRKVKEIAPRITSQKLGTSEIFQIVTGAGLVLSRHPNFRFAQDALADLNKLNKV